MTLLTEHFTLEQLTYSETAVRKGLDNTPDAETIENLRELAETLEQVRELLGCELHIQSGYRSPKVNAAVGGSKKPPSAHMAGYAADFVAPDFGTPLEVCEAIEASDIEFDQLIHEFDNWVHISVDPRMRMSLLTIDADGVQKGLA